MARQRTLEIDEKMDQYLTTICDAALKQGGVQVMDTVMEVVKAVRAASEENPLLD
jgi:hypothetical protein